MSQFISFASGGVSPVNLDTDYEVAGIGTTGAGTTLTSAGSNTAGTPVQLLAASTFDYHGVVVVLGPENTSADRYMVDVSFDGGSTWAIPNLFVHNSATTQWTPVYFPLSVGTGADIRARLRCSNAAKTKVVYVIGIKRQAASPPGYTSVVSLTADTTTTRPDNANVPLTNTWTELITSTSDAYGGLLAIVGDNGSTPGTAQSALVTIGTGGSGSEAAYAAPFSVFIGTANPIIRNGFSRTFEKAIPSGTRLSARINATTTGDNLYVGLWALKA